MLFRSKDNRDFVLGANLFYDGGYQYKVTSKRARINLSHTTYSKDTEGLRYGVKANFMRSNIGDAIMWDHDSLAYNPLDNDPGYRNNAFISVDPFVAYTNPNNGDKHTFNSRYFSIIGMPLGRFDGIKDSLTSSKVVYFDYQYQKQIKTLLQLLRVIPLNIPMVRTWTFMGNIPI